MRVDRVNGTCYNFKTRLAVSQTNLSCFAARVAYQICSRYQNGIGSVEITRDETTVSALYNVIDPFPQPLPSLKEMPITREFVTYVQDANLAGITLRMAKRLSGILTMNIYINAPSMPYKLEKQDFQPISFGIVPFDNFSTPDAWKQDNCLPHTRLFNGLSSPNGTVRRDANIIQSMLNDMLANITVSAIQALKLWTARANITQRVQVNTYSFSRPLHLLLPYSIYAACCLTFLLLRFLALYINGVAAADGFIQLLVATRGSTSLEAAITMSLRV